MDEEEVLNVLWSRVTKANQKGVAEKMGVSVSFLNDVLHKRRGLTKPVLDWLGLERVVTYRQKRLTVSEEANDA